MSREQKFVARIRVPNVELTAKRKANIKKNLIKQICTVLNGFLTNDDTLYQWSTKEVQGSSYPETEIAMVVTLKRNSPDMEEISILQKLNNIESNDDKILSNQKQIGEMIKLLSKQISEK